MFDSNCKMVVFIIATSHKKHRYIKGLKDGVPICLGYIPISFTFGMLASQSGFPVWISILISLTCLTSTGQFAGLSIILAGGAYIELAATIFIINIRYMLMSFALSQRLDDKMTTLERCLVAFGNTDEVFAIAMQQKGILKTAYMLGLITLPLVGWVGGTFLGATATSLLPLSMQSALGITIYGMFVAIILPPAQKSKPVLITVLIAAALSCMFRFTPILSNLSTGWVIIIVAVFAAGYCAFRFPIDDEPDEVEA
ncbi:MAG: AzlC family ABC transporter permease [Oscillospiraceae bacterium]